MKSPYFFFISFSFSYLLSFLFLTFFAHLSFFSSGSMATGVGWGGEVYLITQGRWVLNVRFIICQK